MVLMQKNVVKGRKIWYNKGAYKCKKKPQVRQYLGFYIYQVHNGVLKFKIEVLKLEFEILILKF